MNRIKQLAINDEGFIFDPERGDSYTTNETGLRILALLKEDLPVEKIIAQLATEYDITPHEARQDFDEFCALLRTNHLWGTENE